MGAGRTDEEEATCLEALEEEGMMEGKAGRRERWTMKLPGRKEGREREGRSARSHVKERAKGVREVALTEINVRSGHWEGKIHEHVVGLVLREAGDVWESDERVRRRGGCARGRK